MSAGRQHGFTLLEVLVALVVLGFLMAGLTQGVRLGIAAWGQQTRLIAGREDLDAVDRTFRRLVEQMDPGTRTAPPLIIGTGGRLAFTSVLPAALGSQTADIAIGLGPGHQLLLRWLRHQYGRPIGPVRPPRSEVLLSGVERIEFAYWQAGTGWVRAWTQRKLPALVRMRLVFPPGDKRHWPDLVAAPLRANPVG